jgi:retron-type reverse transcriptase
MSLTTPETVGKLQATLHAKAKESSTYRFYALYDKVYRPDVLRHAYARCRSNRGAAGVDEQTFADIAAYGVEKWLGELAQDLKGKTYVPQPVRRVWIPKADGKQRPLGIPMLHAYCTFLQETLGMEPCRPFRVRHLR